MSGSFAPAQRNLFLDSPRTAAPNRSSTALSVGGIPMAKQYLSGALTANTYKQILNVTGPGVISFLGLTSEDDNAGLGRNLSMQVVIDGVLVINAAAAMGAGYGYGLVGIGSAYSNQVVFQPVPFKKSLVVSIQSDYTETNKSKLMAIYRTC